FEIIAEPNRRAILSLLARRTKVSSQLSVGEIERQLRMPQPTVSKHLRVLREAGFVESTVDAQRRLYRLKAEPLQEVDSWLAQFRHFWSAAHRSVFIRAAVCHQVGQRAKHRLKGQLLAIDFVVLRGSDLPLTIALQPGIGPD